LAAERFVDCADRVQYRVRVRRGHGPEVGCVFGSERIAAAIAERRGQRQDGCPAERADRAARRIFQEFVARRACRREDDDGEAVDAGAAEGRQPTEEASIRSALPQRRSRP
jgi:hypothetical protein